MNPDLAYLVGALRDGSVYYYPKNRSYYTLFYQNNKEWLENSIGKRIKALFGFNYRIDEYKPNQYRLRISSKDLYYLWKNVFLFPNEKEGQSFWNIPPSILVGSHKVKAFYIRAFFDTEGDVSPDTSSTFYIGISQKSKYVLKQLRHLLSEFHITSSSPHLADRKSQTYRIIISSRRSIHSFFEKIGCEHPLKVIKIKKIISRK